VRNAGATAAILLAIGYASNFEDGSWDVVMNAQNENDKWMTSGGAGLHP